MADEELKLEMEDNDAGDAVSDLVLEMENNGSDKPEKDSESVSEQPPQNEGADLEDIDAGNSSAKENGVSDILSLDADESDILEIDEDPLSSIEDIPGVEDLSEDISLGLDKSQEEPLSLDIDESDLLEVAEPQKPKAPPEMAEEDSQGISLSMDDDLEPTIPVEINESDLSEVSESTEPTLPVEPAEDAEEENEEISLSIDDNLESPISLDIDESDLLEVEDSPESSSPAESAPNTEEKKEFPPSVDEPLADTLSLDISEDDLSEVGEDIQPPPLPTMEESKDDSSAEKENVASDDDETGEDVDVAPEEYGQDEQPPEIKGFMEAVTPVDSSESEENIKMAAKYEAEGKKKKKQIIIGAAVFICLLLAAAAGYFLYQDIANYDKAQALWVEANSYKGQKKYKLSQRKAREVLTVLAGIKVLKSGERDSLANQVNALLASTDFKNKVAGKVMYEGKIIKKEAVDKLEKVKTLIPQALEAVNAQKWNEAFTLYEEAREEFNASGVDDSELKADIESSYANSAVNLYVEEAENNLAKEDFDNTLKSLEKASEVIANNSNVSYDRANDVQPLIDKATIGILIRAAESAKADVDLDKSLENFSQALIIAEKNDGAAGGNPQYIKESIREIELYKLLSKGKVEVEKASWNEALKIFDEALNLILANSSDSKLARNETAVRKKRVELAIRISSEKAEISKQRNDLARAVKHKSNVVSIVEGSLFKEDQDLIDIREKAQKDIDELNDQIFINEKLEYLTSNYKTIFQENHSLAKQATLSKPRIVFESQEGSKQIYNLKCAGYTSTGRLALELNYQFDTETNEWIVVGRRRSR